MQLPKLEVPRLLTLWRSLLISNPILLLTKRPRLSSDVSWLPKKEKEFVTSLDSEEMLKRKRQLLVYGLARQKKNSKVESSFLRVCWGLWKWSLSFQLSPSSMLLGSVDTSPLHAWILSWLLRQGNPDSFIFYTSWRPLSTSSHWWSCSHALVKAQ